jgi:hypothetical protein
MGRTLNLESIKLFGFIAEIFYLEIALHFVFEVPGYFVWSPVISSSDLENFLFQ